MIDSEAGYILIDSRQRSRRWTWRRFCSARRGARRMERRLVSVLVAGFNLDFCSIALVPVTFVGLLLAPNLVRPWKCTTIHIAGHPIESIEAVYFDEERVK